MAQRGVSFTDDRARTEYKTGAANECLGAGNKAMACVDNAPC